MELRANEPCAEMKNQSDGAGVGRGVTEVHPCVRARLPLRRANCPGLVCGIQDKNWTPPRVEVGGCDVVCRARESFEGA